MHDYSQNYGPPPQSQNGYSQYQNTGYSQYQNSSYPPTEYDQNIGYSQEYKYVKFGCNKNNSYVNCIIF